MAVKYLKSIDIHSLRARLMEWYKIHHRPLPWRINRNWYHIFLSEYLFQQTQIEQGLPYFYKFVQKFPDITSLAAADEEEILSLWAGLGYYARARNLLKASKIIIREFGGKLPADYHLIWSLPGVGPYTAAALASNVHNLPRAVLDGNVIRVLTRLFAIDADVRSTSAKKLLESLAGQLLDPELPGEFNQAVMELGALVCKPRQPACTICPLQTDCRALKTGTIAKLPLKSKSRPRKNLQQFVFILHRDQKVLICKRPSQGLLASMWEFPSAEAESLAKDEQLIIGLLKEKYICDGKIISELPVMKHDYSHIKLSYKPVIIRTECAEFEKGEYADTAWIYPAQFTDYAVHNAHQKIIGLLKYDI